MPITKLDRIDRHILDSLQTDGRLTNLELADRVGLSPSPCLRRVRNLESEKLIESYGARLNSRKLGLGVSAFIALTLDRHTPESRAKSRKLINAMPEVIACYVTSGDHDLLLQVVVPSLDDYQRFSLDRLLAIPGVKNIRSSFIIETVKEGAPLPLNHLA